MTEPSHSINEPDDMKDILALATASWRMDIAKPAPLHAKLRYVSSLLSALDAPVTVPSLLYQNSPDKPVVMKEIGESLAVGRNAEPGWSLPEEGRMSRVHFRVVRKDDSWWVEDAGSKNGTFLEGEAETLKVRPIVSGDVIFAGGARFAFVLPEQ